jgi:hypothetical protein
MKKSLTLLAFVLGMSGAFAQDLTSKKGEPILPEAGDWGLGIDANPFLEYAGNFFGKTTTNPAPTFNFLGPFQTITGRYFKDATTVYRGSLRIGFSNVTERNNVANLSNTSTAPTYPNLPAEVENVWKHSQNVIGLSAGLEMRRGKTRLQGYYGGEFGIMFASSRDKFEYGNALAVSGSSITVDVDAADAFSVNANGDVANNYIAGPGNIGGFNVNGVRITDRKNGATFGVGLRGFIGVEYFMFPKISLGGEFGWGFMLVSQGKVTEVGQSIGIDAITPGNPVIGETTLEGAKAGAWALDTDNSNSMWGPAGTLRLNFYF